LNGAFDFVLESSTLQSLIPKIRQGALEQVAHLVAPRGELMILCLGDYGSGTTWDSPPYSLAKAELDGFCSYGLEKVDHEGIHVSDATWRSEVRFRIHYRRSEKQ
jgi:hypothetical protein